jgi:hypothetical protein
MPAATPSPSTSNPAVMLTAAEASLMRKQLRALPARDWDVHREQALIRYGVMRFYELYPNPMAPQPPEVVERVMSLMAVPFHLLEMDDQEHRRVLGAQRLKAHLQAVPHYAKAAAKAKSDWDYWSDFWMSQVNLVHPPVESSTAAA